jgi:hypothetical protein
MSLVKAPPHIPLQLSEKEYKEYRNLPVNDRIEILDRIKIVFTGLLLDKYYHNKEVT